MALRIALTVPATEKHSHRPQAGLFTGGFLISFLSPGAALFFAIAFMGLMLPIGQVGDALKVAAIVAIFDAVWHAFLAIALSRPAVRAVVMRRQRTICGMAAAMLGLMPSFLPCQLFHSPEEQPMYNEPTNQRFEVVLSPDNSWAVFDHITGAPAEAGDEVLIGLERQTALMVGRRLNIMTETRIVGRRKISSTLIGPLTRIGVWCSHFLRRLAILTTVLLGIVPVVTPAGAESAVASPDVV